MKPKTFNIVSNKTGDYLGTYLARTPKEAFENYKVDKWAPEKLHRNQVSIIKGVKT